MKRISICIPTYNRAAELEVLFESIKNSGEVSGVIDEFEIIVSDNSSTDGTAEVINQYRNYFPHFKSHVFDENLGPDANYLKVIDMATSEFVWLMGSDDAVSLDGLNDILAVINSDPADLYLMDILKCDKNLNIFSSHSWFASKDCRTYNLHEDSERIRLFDQAIPFWGLLFGYLSAIIFRKDKWVSEGYDEQYSNSLYSFLYPIMKMISRGSIFRHISSNVILNRGDNDSMLADVVQDRMFKRLSHDIFWYEHFGSFFANPNVKLAYFKLAARNFHFYYVLKLRALADDQSWAVCALKLKGFGVSRLMLSCVGNAKFLARGVIFLLSVRKQIIHKGGS